MQVTSYKYESAPRLRYGKKVCVVSVIIEKTSKQVYSVVPFVVFPVPLHSYLVSGWYSALYKPLNSRCGSKC